MLRPQLPRRGLGDGAQEEGANALKELADNAQNRLAITDAGGIGPLVVLLGSKNLKARLCIP